MNKIDTDPATKELVGDMKIKYIIAEIIAVELNIAFTQNLCHLACKVTQPIIKLHPQFSARMPRAHLMKEQLLRVRETHNHLRIAGLPLQGGSTSSESEESPHNCN